MNTSTTNSVSNVPTVKFASDHVRELAAKAFTDGYNSVREEIRKVYGTGSHLDSRMINDGSIYYYIGSSF